MTDPSQSSPVTEVMPDGAGNQAQEQNETVERPAKVMRIGSMIKVLLEEVRTAPLDDKSRARLKEIYETSVKELAETLSPDLKEELAGLTAPFQAPRGVLSGYREAGRTTRV
jgi:hypothetical protein